MSTEPIKLKGSLPLVTPKTETTDIFKKNRKRKKEDPFINTFKKSKLPICIQNALPDSLLAKCMVYSGKSFSDMRVVSKTWNKVWIYTELVELYRDIPKISRIILQFLPHYPTSSEQEDAVKRTRRLILDRALVLGFPSRKEGEEVNLGMLLKKIEQGEKDFITFFNALRTKYEEIIEGDGDMGEPEFTVQDLPPVFEGEPSQQAALMLDWMIRSRDNLAGIKSLYLEKRNLSTLPKAISLLVNLELIDLSDNAFTDVPEVLGEMAELHDLNMSYNQLSAFPVNPSLFNSLTDLNLSHNRLINFFKQIDKIERLNLSHNAINFFPTQIYKVKDLNLSHNKLTFLPEIIPHPIKMTKLNLSYNELIYLPKDMRKFIVKSRVIDITGSKFELDLRIIRSPQMSILISKEPSAPGASPDKSLHLAEYPEVSQLSEQSETMESTISEEEARIEFAFFQSLGFLDAPRT